MSRTGRPASYPDIVMYKHTLPIVWRGTIRSEVSRLDPLGLVGRQHQLLRLRP